MLFRKVCKKILYINIGIMGNGTRKRKTPNVKYIYVPVHPTQPVQPEIKQSNRKNNLITISG
jgi:hypothetical protein